MGLSSVLATLYNEWAIQLVVLVSLVAHVALTLFAGIRRRQGPGLATAILWAAYQLADWATPFVLGKLSVRTLPQEQQLVALWVPFLLTHLAGPDNITAYGLEDDKLSSRKMFSIITTILHAVWASFAIYKQLFATASGDRALLGASLAMGAVAVAKCWLKVSALQEGGFGKIRSASGSKDQQPKGILVNWGWHRHRHGQPLTDGKALLVAHRLLHITKGSFADFPVFHRRELRNDTKELFHSTGDDGRQVGWENLCRVVEMEVSLMYDILYTKAAAIHTSWGYFVCAASPVATATAAVLFWLYRRNQASVVPVHREREADVSITYTLFAVTFILDVRWLLRAAASTWAYAYAFFAAGSPGCWTLWLRHHVFCSGRWRRFRRAVVSLDPRQQLLLLLGDPRRGSYRLWSGNLGSYNLLDDCTGLYTPNPLSNLVKKCAPEDTWFEYEYSSWKSFQLGAASASAQNINRKLLFDQIRKTLEEAYSDDVRKAKKPRLKLSYLPYFPYYNDPASYNNYKPYDPASYNNQQPQRPAKDPEETNKGRRNLDYAVGFVPEFQEAILVLHVATDVFFLFCSIHLTPEQKRYKNVIQVVSNYMAFLAAARPDMVPGLKLRSLYSLTRDSLEKIVTQMNKDKQHGSSTKDKHDLACLLRNMESEPDDRESEYRYRSKLYRRSGILSDGVLLAELLLASLKGEDGGIMGGLFFRAGYTSWNRIIFLLDMVPSELTANIDMDQLLKRILEMWVRLLIFVSTRCGRDSHAKQLARGCELTTIVWILVDHAAIFRIV